MLVHPRTAIRTYLWDALKDATDVGDRVFLNRPNALVIQELPAIAVYTTSENCEISEGDSYVPHQYDRSLNVIIDIVAEKSNDPNSEMRVEAQLDTIARQVERELFNDNFFQKRLDGYVDRHSPGLLAGMRLQSTIPDNIPVSDDRALACQSLSWVLIYLDEAFMEEKSKIIESYLVKFNRVDYDDDDTIDPTLIEASGDLE